jgi:GMP synthase (glutamine-hydrolysing)
MATIAVLVTGDPIKPVARFAGGFDAMIRQAVGLQPDVTLSSIDVRRECLPQPSFDGIIITGSPHSVFQQLPWMVKLEAYVRAGIASGCPTLGICFGHQLIASALGGVVVRNPKGRETGVVLARSQPQNDQIGFPAHAFLVPMVHRDTVHRAPEGSIVLAQTARDAHAALQFNSRCWGVQFHPEFSPDVVSAYIGHQRDALLEQGDDPDALVASLSCTPAATELLRNFVRLVRAAASRDTNCQCERRTG